MRINNNIGALNTVNIMGLTSKRVADATEKMASGLRINRAGDDAAGLAISQKMRSQIRGLSQASRNAQDAISMIQTAEGALQETHSMIQRMRELSVQAASDTNVEKDRKSMQREIAQLTSEVNRIANTTEFNTKNILASGIPANVPKEPVTEEEKIVANLKKWWLDEAEQIVKDSFGISASDINMEIKIFDDSSNNAAAFVKASYTSVPGDAVGQENITGKGSNLSLEINLAHATPVDASISGGEYYQYVDRVITHEITHAVMSTTMNFGDLPIWFIEGSAEFSHGADERLKNNMYAIGGGVGDPQMSAGLAGIVAAFDDGGEEDWNNGGPPSYSAAYLSVRYMDWQIKDSGGTGIQDIMAHLAANDTDTLDDALAAASSGAFTDYADFVVDFTGETWNVANLEGLTGIKLNTNVVGTSFEPEEDTGSVLGFDATGGTGEKKTAESVVPEEAGASAPQVEQPMDGFKLTWPEWAKADNNFVDPEYLHMQIGANEKQSMAIYFNDMQADSIGITGEKGATLTTTSGISAKFSSLDDAAVNNGTDSAVESYAVDIMDAENATAAIEVFDEALEKVSEERSRLGAYQNRLEHSVNNLNVAEENLLAAESRITDADYAKMAMKHSKEQILLQAAQAMFAQNNQSSQAVLQLLR